MSYEKPELALIASAVEAVKGQGDKDGTSFDGQPQATNAAYESDE
jgi:hypothetical protein